MGGDHMFSEVQLKNLSKALRELRDDCHCLTEEELADLFATVEIERYRMQYMSFVDFLTDIYQDYIGKPTEDREGFYRLEWTILFDNKAMKINNDMRIFEALLDVFTTYASNV
jgi:hypothetical protein